MAPPTTSLRLRDLDPHTVALDTARDAIDRIASAKISLYRVDWVSAAPDPEQTEIYRVVRALAEYAVHGHALDAPLHEYLISIVPYLDIGGNAG